MSSPHRRRGRRPMRASRHRVLPCAIVPRVVLQPQQVPAVSRNQSMAAADGEAALRLVDSRQSTDTVNPTFFHVRATHATESAECALKSFEHLGYACGIGLIHSGLRLRCATALCRTAFAHPSPSKNPAAHASSCRSTMQRHHEALALRRPHPSHVRATTRHTFVRRLSPR